MKQSAKSKYTAKQTTAWCLKEWKTTVKPRFDDLMSFFAKGDVCIPDDRFSTLLPPSGSYGQSWNPLFKFVRPDRAPNIMSLRDELSNAEWNLVCTQVIVPYFDSWSKLLKAFDVLSPRTDVMASLRDAVGMLQRGMLHGGSAEDVREQYRKLCDYFVMLPRTNRAATHKYIASPEFAKMVAEAAHQGASKVVKGVKALANSVAQEAAIKALKADGDVKDANTEGKPAKKLTKGLVGHPPPPPMKLAIGKAAAKAGAASSNKGSTYLAGVTAFYFSDQLWKSKGWMEKDGIVRKYFGWKKGETNHDKAIKRLYAFAVRLDKKETKES